RDYKVTGVQTCALPISRSSLLDPRRGSRWTRKRGEEVRAQTGCRTDAARHALIATINAFRRGEPYVLRLQSEAGRDGRMSNECRSEERRVGKECRGRWG